MRERPIRVGVVGVGRGQSFMGGAAALVGLELVAICDTWEARLREVGARHGVATYTDYDAFLAHDLDAVVLANYFHEHAPLAIRALEAGKHVMSECASNGTLAEGVALCRAVEASGCVYMLAENYPFTVFNQEMARVYRTGEIGRVLYAEGEYNHPMAYDDLLRISPGLAHWRNRLPATYYCTHALAPLMWITGDLPVAVSAMAISAPELEDPTVRLGDTGAVILCRMDSGAVFRLFGVGVPGHSNWYRLHGTRGAMESVRGHGYFGPEQVRVWHDPWTRQPGEVEDRVYTPDWPEHGDLARQAGHGGGDFWTNFHFANAIRTGEPNRLDVYHGVAMSSVGILAWKSALAGGQPLPLPDFRDEAARAPYADDTWSPFTAADPPPSIRGRREPSPEAVAHARAVWADVGYAGDE
jgi:predicted dehydrogenase